MGAVALDKEISLPICMPGRRESEKSILTSLWFPASACHWLNSSEGQREKGHTDTVVEISVLDTGQGEGCQKDETAVQSSGLGEIFFFFFFAGVVCIRDTSLVTLKSFWRLTEPCVEIGAPSFDSLFLYFILLTQLTLGAGSITPT